MKRSEDSDLEMTETGDKRASPVFFKKTAQNIPNREKYQYQPNMIE
jgi:hypothetical protein